MRVEKFPGLKGEKLAACFRFSHQKPVYNIIRGGWGHDYAIKTKVSLQNGQLFAQHLVFNYENLHYAK